MTVYSGPVFDMAANQFYVIADHLEIPRDERDRLLMPKRAMTVSCPIHRGDGSVSGFEGYRWQHRLRMGPTKGSTRVAPAVWIGEMGGGGGLRSARARRSFATAGWAGGWRPGVSLRIWSSG